MDMDAPQISTLREEETPEPQPNIARPKPRVKLLMGDSKRTSSARSSPAQKPQRDDSDDDEDDEDDEEDQLIDDDDDEPKAQPLPSISAPPVIEKKPPTVSKRGAHTGTRGRGRGRGRGGSKLARAGRLLL